MMLISPTERKAIMIFNSKSFRWEPVLGCRLCDLAFGTETHSNEVLVVYYLQVFQMQTPKKT